MVGVDAEDREHLVEDLAVLAGDADHRLEPFGALEGVDHRRHLDRFRAGAEYGQDLLHSRLFACPRLRVACPIGGAPRLC